MCDLFKNFTCRDCNCVHPNDDAQTGGFYGYDQEILTDSSIKTLFGDNAGEIDGLLKKGMISVEDAFDKCINKERFAPLLKEAPDELSM